MESKEVFFGGSSEKNDGQWSRSVWFQDILGHLCEQGLLHSTWRVTETQ